MILSYKKQVALFLTCFLTITGFHAHGAGNPPKQKGKGKGQKQLNVQARSFNPQAPTFNPGRPPQSFASRVGGSPAQAPQQPPQQPMPQAWGAAPPKPLHPSSSMAMSSSWSRQDEDALPPSYLPPLPHAASSKVDPQPFSAPYVQPQVQPAQSYSHQGKEWMQLNQLSIHMRSNKEMEPVLKRIDERFAKTKDPKDGLTPGLSRNSWENLVEELRADHLAHDRQLLNLQGTDLAEMNTYEAAQFMHTIFLTFPNLMIIDFSNATFNDDLLKALEREFSTNPLRNIREIKLPIMVKNLPSANTILKPNTKLGRIAKISAPTIYMVT